MGIHDGRGDPAEVMAEIDLISQRLRGHRLIEELQGFDAARKRRKVDLVAFAFVANLKAYEGGDELEVIFDAMLDFLEHRVFVTDLPRELLALRARPFGDIDQRDDAIV